MQMKDTALEKLLLERKILTRAELDIAITEQMNTGKKLGDILISSGYIDQTTYLQLLSENLNIPYIDLKDYSIDIEAFRLLPEGDARRLRAVVLNKNLQGFLVGMVDPLDVLAHDELEHILRDSIQTAIVADEDLERIINVNYRQKSQISSLSEELSVEMGKSDFDITALPMDASVADAPVVKLLRSIFEDAAQINASDVHIEPDEFVLRLRLRIDGVLHEQVIKNKKIADALAVRLKIMAGLNIAEKRVPQDGRFSIKVRNKKFDVRLSSLPSQYGESIVMRLLNQSDDLLGLEKIGMPKDTLAQLREILGLPHGLLLITGPTGSGKTTALYAMLNELNKPDVKIVTVEDPVEYRLTRITQVQVQSAINLTFARVLRAILRQDPDVIMIGEVRDKETAEIALRAAMTGHFVFATLHTNDAPSCAERLIDMGVESFLVASVLNAVISQRLVRRICQNCIEDYTLTSQEKTWLTSVKRFNATNVKFKKGRGCALCHQTGYKGRVGVYEMLVMNHKLSEALRVNSPTFAAMVEDDPQFKSLLMSGLKLVAEGVTTIAEVMTLSADVAFLNEEKTS